ncbi:MAG TPA: hypothetical protein VJP59_08995 [Gemmatimonadota bacterium]|nr:hypothetical protein [Gemmatimonadota bacterium]
MFAPSAHKGHPAVVVMGDGRRFAGLASNFHLGGASLRLREVDRGGSMVEIHDLDMYEVHAIFFVRELGLMRSHRKADPEDPPRPDGPVVQIQFVWGETMEGVLDGPVGTRPGFFLKPLLRTGNLISVYVSRQAVVRVEAAGATATR